MIDWRATAAWLAAVAADPPAALAATGAAVASAPPFRNRDYPVSPSALYVEPAAAADHADRCRRYVEVLAACIAAYREEAAARAYFDLGPAAERLVLAPARIGHEVPVCRLDGYLPADGSTVQFLETNADAPAGTVFTPRLNRVHDEVRAALTGDGSVGEPRFDDDRAFLRLVVEAGVAAGLDRSAVRLAVLAPGAEHPESAELVRLAAAEGVEAFPADPRAIRVVGGRVLFGERPATLCWNKVNTAGWRALVEADGDLVDAWVAALACDEFVAVAPFATRYVAESKLVMAFQRTPVVRERLDAAQAAVVDACTPAAERFPAGGGDDHARRLAELEDLQCELVLKQPYDIRGDGVTVGPASPRPAWSAALRGALASPHLVQRYVPPVRLPVVGGDGEVRSQAVSLDSFVFAGRFVGFGAKANLGAKVNVFQGGAKLPVRVSAR